VDHLAGHHYKGRILTLPANVRLGRYRKTYGSDLGQLEIFIE